MLSSDVSQLGFVCVCMFVWTADLCVPTSVTVYVLVRCCLWSLHICKTCAGRHTNTWVYVGLLVQSSGSSLLHHPSDVLCVGLFMCLQLQACMYVSVQGWGCSSRLYTEVSTERSAGYESPRHVSLSMCQCPRGVHSARFPLQKSVSISHLSSSQKCCATFWSLWTRQQ